MKNFKYKQVVFIGILLLTTTAAAFASQTIDSQPPAPATPAEDTVVRKVVEEPAMAAIPPVEKGAAKNAGQLDFSKVQEDPAMAAIPGK